MLDKPQIIQTDAQLTAIIRLTIPRDEIRNVMGPGIAELMTAVAAQGMAPAGPIFSHHLRMDPAIFDFEIGVPVNAPISTAGRVKASRLPAATVARTVYHRPYERASAPPGASSMPGSLPQDTRQPRTSGSAISRAQNRARTRPPGVRNSTARCLGRAEYRSPLSDC